MRDAVERNRTGIKRKLTWEQAAEIRERYEDWKGSKHNPNPNGQSALAREYGVTQSVIRQIVHNITYTIKETV